MSCGGGRDAEEDEKGEEAAFCYHTPFDGRLAHLIVPHLYLSGIAALTPGFFSTRRIGLVISLCVSSEYGSLPAVARGLRQIRVSVRDTADTNLLPHFASLSATIADYRRRGQDVLVHCVAGISRSAAVVLAHLMDAEGMSLRQAYHHTKTRRWVIQPNPGFLRQLLEWEGKLWPQKAERPTVDPLVGWPRLPDPRNEQDPHSRTRVRRRSSIGEYKLVRRPSMSEVFLEAPDIVEVVSFTSLVTLPTGSERKKPAVKEEAWMLASLYCPRRLCSLVAVLDLASLEAEEAKAPSSPSSSSSLSSAIAPCVRYVRPTVARMFRASVDLRQARGDLLPRSHIQLLRTERLLARRIRWATVVPYLALRNVLAADKADSSPLRAFERAHRSIVQQLATVITRKREAEEEGWTDTVTLVPPPAVASATPGPERGTEGNKEIGLAWT